MAQSSKIEWTDATWNPVIGCSKVSPGCEHCYAERMAWRLAHNPATPEYRGVVENGRWNGLTRMVSEKLVEPLRWRRPRMVFVCSMSDLFHESVPDGWIYEVFGVMALARQHAFQVLTKRPGRMQEYLSSYKGRGDIMAAAYCIRENLKLNVGTEAIKWPLPNVWLGVSAENQKAADERMPLLLRTPAAVWFVSMEPLLGPVTLRFPWLFNGRVTNHPVLDWLIVGGESGPGARPMHPDWARSLRDQCQAAGVPFFFKQWGEWLPFRQVVTDEQMAAWTEHKAVHEWGRDWASEIVSMRVGKHRAGRLLDGREWNEMPEVTRG
jgi:protein gp37